MFFEMSTKTLTSAVLGARDNWPVVASESDGRRVPGVARRLVRMLPTNISDWGDPEMVFLGNEPKKHATRDADGRQTDLTTIKFGISTSVQKAVRRN